MLPEPTTTAVAERINLPRTLTEDLLQKLYREKLIEVKMQSAIGSTRYAMLDHGWDRLTRCCRFAVTLDRRRFLCATIRT